MSEKSSNSRPLSRVAARLKHRETDRRYNWQMLALLPVWVAAAYVVSNLFIAAILIVLNWSHVSLDNLLRPAILQTAIATLVYAITIAIVVGVPYLVHRKLTTNLASLGLNRLISWTDIGLAPVTFLAYTLSAAVVLAVVVALVPGFPVDQTQDTGFNAFGSQTDNLMAFGTLVVLAPLAEETLFRGYLYGKLKTYVPAILAALMTSLLFGLAHMQWNVGIDVFVLSLFLCGLRSLTGSIWAGVLVHIIKNGIAYYILFISPFVGG